MNKRRREGERRVGLQWLYSGSTVAKGRTKDEGKTNKRRTKDEQKTNKRRTKDEQKTNKRRTKDEQKTNLYRG